MYSDYWEIFLLFFSLSDRNVIFEIYSMPYISTFNNVCMNNDFCQPGKGSLIGEILHIAELREFGDSFFFFVLVLLWKGGYSVNIKEPEMIRDSWWNEG